jgi:prepilin-type N-terminal cleavage/methylation domain-containing protein
MKTRPATLSPARAFTLIELITVIAIIAILMSLLFPVIAGVREAARRNKARTVVKAVVNACKSYSTDYGKYPPIRAALATASNGGTSESEEAAYYSYGDTQVAKCKVTNNQLFDVLRGIDREPNDGHNLNRRKQSYFEQDKVTDLKNPRDGFTDGKAFPPELQGQLLDPWGKQYCIILDADGDGQLKLDAFFQDLTEPIRDSAAAFSMAKNHDLGGKGYQGRFRQERSNEAPDDVASWE